MAPVPAIPPVSAGDRANDETSTGTPGPAPLKIDVIRGDDGVFVYTLTDPGTGAVLAVIPREAVRAGRDGRNLDERV